MDRATYLSAASYHAGLFDLPALGSVLPGARAATQLTVRAVFSHAWNLQTTEGWIVSVTTHPFNGPLSIRLNRSTLHDLGIKPGMTGSLQETEVVVGRVRLRLDHAIVWDPHPPASEPGTEAPAYRRNGRGGVREGNIVGNGDSTGGGTVDRPKPGATFGVHTHRLPLSHRWERGMGDEGLSALEQALLSLDRPVIPHHALSLLGLGSGLTPSGDDVLVGLLAGLFVLGHRIPGSPALDIIPLITDVVMDAAPARTTALSRTMLYYAAHGVAVEPLLDVLQAPFGQPAAEGNVKGLHRLLSIGHSSGRDMLAGAMLALEAVERWEDMGAATLVRPA